MNPVMKQMRQHVSVRKFKKDKIPKEKLHQILEAAQWASTSQFIQAYSVIHMTDEARLSKIAHLASNSFIENTGAFLIFCVDMKRLEMAASKHDGQSHAQNTEAFILGVADTAIFTQNVVLGLESEGYGICYIGGIRNGIKEIGEYLELPDGVIPLFGLAIGIPDEQNEPKPRLPLEGILHENTFSSANYEKILEAYDQTMNTYYSARSTNQKEMTWTKAMSDVMGAPRRPQVDAYVREKGFLRSTES